MEYTDIIIILNTPGLCDNVKQVINTLRMHTTNGARKKTDMWEAI
jgi:hypothetical protein